MYRSLPDEIFDCTSNIFILHGGAHPLFIVYLPVDSRFVIMFTLLDVDVDFGELLRAELSLQFRTNA